MGKTLRIIPAVPGARDVSILQPILSVEFQGGHPILFWKINGTHALEIEADMVLAFLPY